MHGVLSGIGVNSVCFFVVLHPLRNGVIGVAGIKIATVFVGMQALWVAVYVGIQDEIEVVVIDAITRCMHEGGVRVHTIFDGVFGA